MKKGRILRSMRFHEDGMPDGLRLEEGTVVEIVPFDDVQRSEDSWERVWAESLRRRGRHKTRTFFRWEGKIRCAEMGRDIQRLDEKTRPPVRSGPRAATTPSWATRKEDT